MPLTLLHLSDLHFGALDPRPADALPDYAAEVAPGCTAILVSGDLTQRARPWQFRQARAWLDRLGERLGCPWHSVAGNHDVPLHAVWERFACPLRRYRGEIGPETFQLTLPGLRVFGVNTARPFVPVLRGFWKDGRLGPRDLDPLDLRPEVDGDTLRIVVAHHPLAPPPWAADDHGVALGVREALPRLRAAGVHLVLGGHLHVQYAVRLADTPDGIGLWSVQAATATSHRRRHLPPPSTGERGSEHPCGFNVLTVSPARELILAHHVWLSSGSIDAGREGGGGEWRGGEVRILGRFGG